MAGAYHYLCDQTGVTVDFYVDPTMMTTVLDISGTTVESGFVHETLVNPENVPAWKGDCRMESYVCSVKRDTAFARVSALPWPDGSYFALGNVGTKPVPELHWISVQRGYREADGTINGLTNWGETAWTNCPSGRPNVIYTSSNSYTESSGLNMSAGNSNTSCFVVNGTGLSD